MVIMWATLGWIIVLGTLTCLCCALSRRLRIVWLMVRLPGPFALPLIGNALQLILYRNDFIQLVCDCQQKYGPICRIWASIFPMVVLSEPQHIQKILSSSKHLEKSYFYTMLPNFVGDGLITLDVEKWRIHRKLMTPSFHVNFLRDLVGSFNTGTDRLIRSIEDHLAGRKTSDINFAPFINKCVFNILSDVILDIQPDEENTEEIVSSLFHKGSINLQYRWFRPWLFFNPMYKLTESSKTESNRKNNSLEYLKEILEKKKRKGSPDPKRSYIDFLLEKAEESEEFTEEDCVQEARTLMLAGQESVATATALCLHQLANHPRVQEKVVEELNSIFDSSDRDPTFSDLKEMKFLDDCVKETLRLYPIIPFVARKLGEDVLIDDYKLPKGCEVVIAILATHRHPAHHPNPHDFNPERFGTEKYKNREPFSYLPFSAGPRNCIGYQFGLFEMKIILSGLLRRFSVSPVEDKNKLKIGYRVTLRNSGGVWIQFNPRV